MSTIAENVAEWVAALRSDEFEQGVGALNQNGKHCCLGVLCELAVAAGVPIKVEVKEGFTSYDGKRGDLPDKVRKWVGLRTAQGGYGDNGWCLSAENDAGMSFAGIADLIESRPERLFA